MSPVLSLLPVTLRVYSVETPPGEPPAVPRLPLAFAPFLFLTPAHQALQEHGQPVLAFFLEDVATGQTVAHFYVVPDADPSASRVARSPGQASFGGVQLAANLPVAALHPLLDVAEAALRQRGQRTLVVRGYPFCYDLSGAATLAEALRQRGYEVGLAEENYYLDTQRDFETHLHRSERKRLRKCHRQGLVVEQEPPILLPAAYEFIAACRRERSQPLSLPLARVEALFRAFPQQHFLFSVRRHGGEWVALSLAIRVSERALYNFYHASPIAANDLSPVVMLNEGLHAFAKANELAIVDLGISTLPGGIPHNSLLQFKRHLGCVASLKLTWHKALS